MSHFSLRFSTFICMLIHSSCALDIFSSLFFLLLHRLLFALFSFSSSFHLLFKLFYIFIVFLQYDITMWYYLYEILWKKRRKKMKCVPFSVSATFLLLRIFLVASLERHTHICIFHIMTFTRKKKEKTKRNTFREHTQRHGSPPVNDTSSIKHHHYCLHTVCYTNLPEK